MLSPSGQARLSGVSVFSDTGPLWEAIELRTNHSVKVIPKVLHNKYVSYSIRFTQNYLSHFSPRFQFVIGDEIARSRVPGMGQWYLFLFPFFALGIYKLFSISSPGSRFTAAWLFISPLAAAITFQSPHALRAQNMVIPMVIIIALGFQAIYSFISNRFILILISSFLILISSFEVSRYLHQYYVHYPQELPYAWQYGFDQIADYVQSHQDEYDQVVITDRYDQPYILMAFYMKYQPTRMQQELKMEPRDKFGFSTARQVGKLFYRSIDFNKEIQQKNSLIIVANEPVPDNVVPIHTICFPDGSPGYRFYSSK
jgi:hypothetical protein